MKKIYSGIITLSLVLGAANAKSQNQKELKYPETKKVDTVTDYFGTKVNDPYRWLEDDRSEETENWVEAENKVTFNYLENIPYRDQLKKRLTKLWDYEKLAAKVLVALKPNEFRLKKLSQI